MARVSSPRTCLVFVCHLWLLDSASINCTIRVALNSLAPGRPRCHVRTAIFNLVLLIGIFTSSKDNALRWMPRDFIDDKSTLVQVMAWCRRQQSITRANFDLVPCRYMASPGNNELTPFGSWHAVFCPPWMLCEMTSLWNWMNIICERGIQPKPKKKIPVHVCTFQFCCSTSVFSKTFTRDSPMWVAL